MIEQNSF